QNVDDLHERAGSTNVLHLHGELFKVRSTREPSLIYDWKKDLCKNDLCDLGAQLRPHIVWFGEMVPNIESAAHISRTADIYLVVGTSLMVYPAAGLINYTEYHVPKYIIDPGKPEVYNVPNVYFIQEKASVGTPRLVTKLIEDEQQ